MQSLHTFGKNVHDFPGLKFLRASKFLDGGDAAGTFGQEHRPPHNNDNNDNDFQNLVDMPDALPFPLMALPPSVRQFVREGAASIGCAVDFVGLSVLSALSAAIGDSRRVVLKKDWAESTALYAMLVGPPGSKKTPAMKLALAPIRARQLALKNEHDRQREEYESQLRDYKKPKKKASRNLPNPRSPRWGVCG